MLALDFFGSFEQHQNIRNLICLCLCWMKHAPQECTKVWMDFLLMCTELQGFIFLIFLYVQTVFHPQHIWLSLLGVNFSELFSFSPFPFESALETAPSVPSHTVCRSVWCRRCYSPKKSIHTCKNLQMSVWISSLNKMIFFYLCSCIATMLQQIQTVMSIE